MAPQVVAAALVFSLVDFLVSSMLFSKGFSLAVLVSSCATFNPARSALDLWLWAWLRGALLVGVALGVARNRRAGPGRASSSATAVVFVAMVIATYAVAKGLVLSEEKSLLQQPWELSLIVWSCVASVALALIWRQLGNTSRRELGNTQDGPPLVFSDDREQLLDPCQDQDQDQSGSKVQDQDQSGSKVQDQDQSNSGATLGRLLCYCRKDFCLLSLATAFLLISAVCEAFIPLFYGLAIDHIVQQQSLDQPVLKLAALALSSSIAMGVRGGVFTLIFARLNLRLRNHLFTSFMRQEIGFYDHNHTGDLLSRLAADTTQVSDLVSQNVNILLRSLVKAVGFCIFMFSISCKLTVLTLLGLPFIGLVSEVYGDYYKRLTKAVQSTLAEANRVAEETLSSMRTVRSFANEREEAESYYGKLLLMFDLNKKQALAYAAYMWCSSFSEVALEVSVLYYGGHLVVSGQISSGALISFFIYMLQLGECLESVSSVYSGLMSGVGAAEKVFEFLDREPQGPGPDPGPGPGLEEPETCSGLVEFRDVHFSYPSRPETEVLKGVSFSLQPGHVTALVGPSGGGKSSCVSLLENFYVPQSGQVLLDGRPVQTLTHHFLHSQVALVSQEPVLFARSVEENICYGLKDPAEGAVERAARQANAHDFICDLHQGYKTSVGEKGAQLSGGQKQRVAIARALVRDPRVLILDEATSALDAHSEHLVQKALQAAMGNRTVLVVAHRLSSVENADRIVVIHQGGVAEQGTHHELMQRRGLYRRLVQRQLRDPDPDPDLDQDCRADLGPQGGGARSQGGGARTRSHSSEEEEADFRPRF